METESALSSYHIFNTVAEAGNISKAAKTLYLSQPAISRAVSKLEQSLSVRLFIRNSRGVHLTEEGKMLYEHTRSAFHALRQGEETLRRIQNLGIGSLRISTSTTLCKYVLMPYLQRFIREYPHIQLHVECHTPAETIALLEDGAIDIGLISESSGLHPLEFLPVTEIEDVFVASETYLENLSLRGQQNNEFTEKTSSAKRRKTSKKTSDSALSFLKDATLLLLEDNQHSLFYLEDYFEQHHIEAGAISKIKNMDLLIDFSKIGLGIGCVAKEFVQKELEDNTLIEIPLPSGLKKRSIGFAFHKTILQAASAEKFIEFYKGENR